MAASISVLVGSALGGLLRYWASLAAARSFGPSYPWGTLGVNVLGSGILGFLAVFLLERTTASPEARLFLTTGFLGGFTTFSTFAYETVRFVEDGFVFRAAGYAAANLLLGVLAAAAGIFLARGRW